MIDNNWEMINGPAAHQIERINATSTINVMEATVTFLIAYSAQQGRTGEVYPNAIALSELHRSGTLFLLTKPGIYRDCPVFLYDANDTIVYTPPPHTEVQKHMDDFFNELATIWGTGDALDVAAFALWRINWVHPFKNGNGRTARAFSYACLCTKLGALLPGTTTIIDQIMTTRAEYEAAIRVGDAACVSNPSGRDLQTMKDYLNRLLQIQMASVEPA